MSDTGLKNLLKKDIIYSLLKHFSHQVLKNHAQWTIKKIGTAPKAASEIHTDFDKVFIKAETVSYDDFINNKGWVKSKESGKMRLEGKDYIVKDGDILNFQVQHVTRFFHTKINLHLKLLNKNNSKSIFMSLF